MRRLLFLSSWLVLTLVTLPASGQQIKNELLNHPAPYLALHGDDPVAWQKWNADTVDMSRDSGKILYLSVGYFSCHWCHVMQRESYQNDDVADFLNEHFVSVKIDRELEAALDKRLMNFAQRTLGRGGWPLNVFLTPDGQPIYALLYMRQPEFLQTLTRLQSVWENDRDRVLGLIRAENQVEFSAPSSELNPTAIAALLQTAAPGILSRADTLAGGFGQNNKFPSAPQMEYLLDVYAENPSPDLEDFLRTTLDSMANLGMQDHLVGGFFRYTVDVNWETPHFEKMLYDNANLANLYRRAADVLNNSAYLKVSTDTLDFMKQRMWHEEGALVSAFSAVDEAGEEGGNYLWTNEELRAILSEDEFEMAVFLFGLREQNELPAGNQPRKIYTVPEYARARSLDESEVDARYASMLEKMIRARDSRPLPVDDKLLAGWNGLALFSYAEAARSLNRDDYRRDALALRDYIFRELWQDGRLIRSRVKGNVLGSASIEDYAYVARGMWSLAQLTGDQADYDRMEEVVRKGWALFYRDNGWYEEDGSLLAPPTPTDMIADGSSASPSGILAQYTLMLAQHLNDPDMRKQAISAINRGDRVLRQAPFWYVSQLKALQVALETEG
ncbi:MAG: DUF255 domain-containing protein [Pseudomonadota bacterium]